MSDEDPIRERRVVRAASVLVLEEKHGPRYFYVPDDAALNRVCLGILRQRDADGYWYPEPKMSDYVDPSTADRHERGLIEYQNDQRWWALMKELVSQPPEEALARTNRAGWPLCYLVLRQRCAGEYEGFSLELFETMEI